MESTAGGVIQAKLSNGFRRCPVLGSPRSRRLEIVDFIDSQRPFDRRNCSADVPGTAAARRHFVSARSLPCARPLWFFHRVGGAYERDGGRRGGPEVAVLN